MKTQVNSRGDERNLGLSDSALVVLSEAANRDNRMVLPLPASIRARGGAKDKLLRKLLRLELIEDVPAPEAEHAWWTRDDGCRVALQISAKGLHAIGIDDPNDAPGLKAQIESGHPSPTAPDAGAVAGREAAAEGEFNGEQGSQVVSSPPLRLRPGSKQALLVDHLSSGEGCTLDELVKLLGWQRHTVRAALTGLRQKGLRIAKSKSAEGETRYHAFSWPDRPS